MDRLSLVVNRIDMKLLVWQRVQLIDVLDNTSITKEQKEAIEGVLNMTDALLGAAMFLEE